VVWTPSSLKSLPVATVVPPSEMRAAPNEGGALAAVSVSRGHALDPAGRKPGHDLAPQDGRHLVAVEPVEDTAGLLGIDQAAIEVPPLLDGAGDGLGGDLVEDHALDRDGG